MSKAQHYKTRHFKTLPSASSLSEEYELGWECVSIVSGGLGDYTVYFKRT